MKEIAKNVYQLALMPRNSINCYIIDNILIDAGIRSSANRIAKAIKNHPIKKHVLTHAHADHQGCSSVICQQLNVPLITSESEQAVMESGRITQEYPNQRHFISRFQQKFWAGPAHPVSQTIKEGDQIGSFVVIETPGHSKGHLSFFRESDRVLIVGDALVNMNLLTTSVGLRQPPDLFTSDKNQNIESIKKIHALNPRILCFGHGPVLVNNGDLDRFMERL
ncbi:MBL fold metallo-hydrolase [Solitalea longa]|uniref:MBL fold metallo-hydrolase n=1 Tax=Solitalea longa TaxID=2079460 RepID=A0A2S5AAE5_9SPHI|nr:MBL fold metallo-hydrolase [Solitalea longa]POY39207.1 MBL fold metallo-hydrolase [Solitalea longa]